jgi:uncharacterized membrane protein YjjP (DUF1212 family)
VDNNKQQNAIQKFVQAVMRPAKEELLFDRFDESITPNMRALRLSVNVADTLIAMGVPVADVVSQSLDITDRYCRRKVQIDISSTLITVSQDRGDAREPLTIIRHAQPRTTNYMTVQSIQELVRKIRSGLDLDTAEKEFDDIITNPLKYPYWLTIFGSGLISAGVGILYGAKPVILLIMFVVAALVSYFLRLLVHHRIPTFYAQIFASILIVLIAALVRKVDDSNSVSWIQDVNPSLIVIGGIVMLVAGLTVVSAVQDAIDEFYVTANARLLKVVMMTVGIVAGVLTGMYFAKKMGVYIPTGNKFVIAASDWQFIGAFLLSAGYALSMQTRFVGVLVSGAIGILAWYVYTLMLSVGGALAAIIASAVAATVAGVVATLIARISRTPSVGLMMAGIITLVPGITLYNGLLSLVSGGYDDFAMLLEAGFIALAIASGVGFGHLVARPVNRTVVRARNALPRRTAPPNV